MARDKGYSVIEERFTRDELYIADEVFFTGTAAELTPIREVDERQIGAGRRGPVTEDIQNTFFDVIKGKAAEKYASWLYPTFRLRQSHFLVEFYHQLRLILHRWQMPSDPTLRVTMLPRDTNARGTIFGGVILSHIDLAGGSQRRAARRETSSPGRCAKSSSSRRYTSAMW